MKPLRVALEEAAANPRVFLPMSRPMLWLYCLARAWDGGCDRNHRKDTLFGLPIVWNDEEEMEER